MDPLMVIKYFDIFEVNDFSTITLIKYHCFKMLRIYFLIKIHFFYCGNNALCFGKKRVVEAEIFKKEYLNDRD